MSKLTKKQIKELKNAGADYECTAEEMEGGVARDLALSVLYGSNFTWRSIDVAADVVYEGWLEERKKRGDQ